MTNTALLKIYPELNVGDDLFLSILLNRYRNIDFFLLANRNMYKKFSNENENLKIIDTIKNVNLLDRLILRLSRNFPVSVQKKIYKFYIRKQYGESLINSEFFVTIGGSMFIENKNDEINRNLLFYQLINDVFKNKPKFFIGCNFGPYYSNKFLEDFKSVFKEASDLSFREHESKTILNLPELRVNPDIVFGFRNLSKLQKIKNSIGFVLVDPKLKMPNEIVNYTEYIKNLNQLMVYYDEIGYKIYLFSYCKRENDEELINDVLNLGGLNNANVIKYDGALNSFINEYSKMETVFCGRFHSMILSMLFGQMILPVIYSKKMTNILGDIRFSGDIVQLKDLNANDPDKYLQIAKNNRYDIDLLKSQADSHFEKIDQLIK